VYILEELAGTETVLTRENQDGTVVWSWRTVGKPSHRSLISSPTEDFVYEKLALFFSNNVIQVLHQRLICRRHLYVTHQLIEYIDAGMMKVSTTDGSMQWIYHQGYLLI
jgi:hypothetical protein